MLKIFKQILLGLFLTTPVFGASKFQESVTYKDTETFKVAGTLYITTGALPTSTTSIQLIGVTGDGLFKGGLNSFSGTFGAGGIYSNGDILSGGQIISLGSATINGELLVGTVTINGYVYSKFGGYIFPDFTILKSTNDFSTLIFPSGFLPFNTYITTGNLNAGQWQDSSVYLTTGAIISGQFSDNRVSITTGAIVSGQFSDNSVAISTAGVVSGKFGDDRVLITTNAIIGIQWPIPVSTQQVLKTGTNNVYYSTASTGVTPRQLRIRMVGGGGGGGSGEIDYPGVQGSSTIFNGIEAGGGYGGIDYGKYSGGEGGYGGAGGAGVVFRAPGQGGGGASHVSFAAGGVGGGSLLGGGAAPGLGLLEAKSGVDAKANSGGGGSGGNQGSGNFPGGGGGGGEYVELIINNPSPSYIYTIGGGGAGGTGPVQTDGGAGGSGIIIIDEYY